MTIEEINQNLWDNKILTNGIKLYIKQGMFKTFVIDYSDFNGRLYIYELSDEKLEDIKDNLSLSFNETIDNLIVKLVNCLEVEEILKNNQMNLKKEIINYLR